MRQMGWRCTSRKLGGEASEAEPKENRWLSCVLINKKQALIHRTTSLRMAERDTMLPCPKGTVDHGLLQSKTLKRAPPKHSKRISFRQAWTRTENYPDSSGLPIAYKNNDSSMFGLYDKHWRSGKTAKQACLYCQEDIILIDLNRSIK